LIALTVIPFSATAGARLRVNASIAPFVAPYASSSGMGPRLWPEVMLMILPPSPAAKRRGELSRQEHRRPHVHGVVGVNRCPVEPFIAVVSRVGRVVDEDTDESQSRFDVIQEAGRGVGFAEITFDGRGRRPVLHELLFRDHLARIVLLTREDAASYGRQ
jgi:hypothetical protein